MKHDEYWALYNRKRDFIYHVNKSKKRCKEEAMKITGDSWEISKQWFNIVKVNVEPVGEE